MVGIWKVVRIWKETSWLLVMRVANAVCGGLSRELPRSARRCELRRVDGTINYAILTSRSGAPVTNVHEALL